MDDPQLASTILYVTTAIGFVAWLAGLTFLLASRRAGRPRGPEADDRFTPDDRPPEGMIVGGTEVAGTPAVLAEKLASLLARHGLAGRLVKILDKAEDRVDFELLGPMMAAGSGGPARRGVVRFRPVEAGRTRCDYAVESPAPRRLLAVGAIFVGLGLIALTAGFWTIRTYVLPSPQLRPQVVQMVQVVHFLWPPFLFGGLYRQARNGLRAGLETTIHNLPYAEP